MTEILIAVLGGSALGSTLSALINQIGAYISDRRRRKDHKEDTTDKKEDALKQGMKLLLADKIQYLAIRFIEDNEITFQNRKMLNEMHKCYHNGLGGNGDFDTLMEKVNDLPLKA